jgi:hypothetical protein
MRRTPIFLAMFVLLCLFLFSPLAASASTLPFHDKSHPVAVSYPCAGQSLTGVGSFKAGDSVKTSHCASKRGMNPDAGNPSGQCINGVVYLQWNNRTFYASNSGGNVAGYVQYYWCPTYSDPNNGINWSYGREYPISGCGNFDTGSGWGANMKSSTGIIENDGEGYHIYNNICTGNYIWDYSQTGSGAYHWLAWMWAHNTATGGYCQPITPGYL